MLTLLSLFYRKPDIVIGEGYLLRWHIIPRNRFFNIYLHKFCKSDDDRALHDHPWPSLSICLKGCMKEQTHDPYYIKKGIQKRIERHISRFKIIFRPASFTHRLELYDDHPVWTIFITGSVIREWGFHCPNGWIHWKIFTDYENGDRTAIGRGCGEH